MHCISIQIQPGHTREFDRQEFLTRVRPIRSPEIDAIDEKGELHLSFNFFTEFPAQLWQQLQECLYLDTLYAPKIAPHSMVICESEETGECLLLHHYNSSETPDRF